MKKTAEECIQLFKEWLDTKGLREEYEANTLADPLTSETTVEEWYQGLLDGPVPPSGYIIMAFCYSRFPEWDDLSIEWIRYCNKNKIELEV